MGVKHPNPLATPLRTVFKKIQQIIFPFHSGITNCVTDYGYHFIIIHKHQYESRCRCPFQNNNNISEFTSRSLLLSTRFVIKIIDNNLRI